MGSLEEHDYHQFQILALLCDLGQVALPPP